MHKNTKFVTNFVISYTKFNDKKVRLDFFFLTNSNFLIYHNHIIKNVNFFILMVYEN